MAENAISVEDLAARLNLQKHPRSWRGDCPACGYPRAFALRSATGGTVRLFCSNGCTWETLNQTVRLTLGGAWTPPAAPGAEDVAERRRKRQEAARRLWTGSTAASGTLAAVYLAARGLPELAVCTALRFRGDAPHPEGGKLPAMVAQVVDADGAPVAVHRTYLARGGHNKAAVAPPKASLGPVWGGAVRLAPVAEEIVVGEGIETSASAGRLLGLPAWAALSAGNLAKGLVLPPEIVRVVIAADADPPDRKGRRPGQEAARTAAMRWNAEGRTVRIAKPDREGCDFNDILRGAGNG